MRGKGSGWFCNQMEWGRRGKQATSLAFLPNKNFEKRVKGRVYSNGLEKAAANYDIFVVTPCFVFVLQLANPNIAVTDLVTMILQFERRRAMGYVLRPTSVLCSALNNSMVLN